MNGPENTTINPTMNSGIDKGLDDGTWVSGKPASIKTIP